jgi:hypothetical protein
MFAGAPTAPHAIGRITITLESPPIPSSDITVKGNHMDATSKTALVIALVGAGLLLLLFGGGMMTGTIMSGGIMGGGSMGGISWMWFSTLLVALLGVALFSVISGKK